MDNTLLVHCKVLLFYSGHSNVNQTSEVDLPSYVDYLSTIGQHSKDECGRRRLRRAPRASRVRRSPKCDSYCAFSRLERRARPVAAKKRLQR